MSGERERRSGEYASPGVVIVPTVWPCLLPWQGHWSPVSQAVATYEVNVLRGDTLEAFYRAASVT